MSVALFALALGISAAAPPVEGASAEWTWGDPVHWVDQTPVGDAVVGGTPAEEGSWDDAVGVVFWGAYVGCTGTLIGPRVVITAGHCVGGISHVLVGSKDWQDSRQGEMIEVADQWEYPDSWATYDVAVLKLRKPSTYEPRAIAMECIIEEYLDDGAQVAVVGYGNTNTQGDRGTTLLNEGVTVVQDHDCDENFIDDIFTGCNPSVSPGGELGAGGNGVDACFGDSGGPLYLLTDVGAYLVGVTSRAYTGVSRRHPCRDGGIYVRPDAIVPWIVDDLGLKIAYPLCNVPAGGQVGTIYAEPGEMGSTRISVTDPDGPDGEVTFAVAVDPANGTATVDRYGVIRYTPNAGFQGAESFVVALTDAGNDWERSGRPATTEIVVSAVVEHGAGKSGCGCATGGAGSVGWLGLGLALLGLRRR